MSDEEKFSAEQPADSHEALEKAAMQDGQVQDVHAQLMREKEEPHEGFSPVPIFLMFAFAALCFWGGVYLVKFSGGFQANAYHPNYDPKAALPTPPELTLFERGAKVYKKQCLQCHQDHGNGVPGVYPPLDGSDWVTGHPEVVARVLINGLNGNIEVKGETYNGNMPAFGPSGLGLSNKDIAGVITYIRQSWSNEASDVTVETIDGYSALYAARSTQWQAAELKDGLGPIPEIVVPVVEEEDAAEGEAEAVETEDAHH